MTDYQITATDHGDAATLNGGDPVEILVTIPSSGGGGAVDSVNGETGVVVLVASDVGAQPVDTDLTAIAALTTTPFGRSLLTAADAAAARTLTGAGTSSLALGTSSSTAKAGDYQPTAANISDASAIGRTVLKAADAAAIRSAIGAGTSSFDGAYASLTGKPTLGTAAASATTDFDASGAAAAAQAASQPLDSDLTAIAALATTSFGRSLLTAADAAAARSTLGAGTSSFDGVYSSLTSKPTLGTAAAKDIPATGDAAVGQVVYGTDTRLTDARTPTTHSHAESDVTGLVADLAAKVPTTRTVAGHALSADVTLVKGDVGLGNVDNTADTAKPVSTAQQTALDLKANLASPTFTGHPVGVTESPGNNSTRLATTAYADAAVAAGGGGGGGTRTLNAQSTSYTAVLGDASTVVVMSNSASATVTIPTNASVAFASGTELEIALTGAGPLIIAGASGVTISSYASIKLIRPGDTVRLIKVGTNAWAAIGGWLPVYASVVLADAPLAFYRFSETSGTTLNDLSGNSHAGTYAATKTSQAGLLNDDSDGATAQYASVTSASWMNVNSIAIECLLKATADPTNSGIAARFNAANDWLLWFDTGGKLAVRFYNASASSVDIPWATAPTLGVTYHVWAQYTSGAASLWINGQLVGFKDTLTGNLAQGSTDLDIRSYQGSGHNAPIVLDELAIYGAGNFNSRRIMLHSQAA